jgi:hypothetical protein
MNSLYENKSNYLVVNHSDYYYCPTLGHYLHKVHLESCDANHTVWA